MNRMAIEQATTASASARDLAARDAAATGEAPPSATPLDADPPPGTDFMLWRMSSVEERATLLRESAGAIDATDDSALLAQGGASASQASASADRIEAWMSSEGIGQWVGLGDIRKSMDELTSLDGPTADTAVVQLESRGTLEKLMWHIADPTVGRLRPSTDTVTAFYDDMAGKLTGESLGTMTIALERTLTDDAFDDGNGWEGVERLAESVGRSADTETKLQFIRALRERTTEADAQSAQGNNPVSSIDSDSMAVGTVIVSMAGDFDALNAALSLLDDAQLEAVVAAGTNPPSLTPRGQIDRSARFDDLAAAVTSIDSRSPEGVEQIGRFIAASNARLRGDPRTAEDQGFKDGLSRVMNEHLPNLLGASLSTGAVMDRDFAGDLETFAQFVLFSEPAGELQSEAAATLRNQIVYLVNASQTAENGQVFVGDVNPVTRAGAANLGGQLLAHTMNGMQFAVEDNAAAAAGNTIAVNMFIDMAFEILPVPELDGTLQSLYKKTQGLTATEIKTRVAAGMAEIDPTGFGALYHATRESIGEGRSAEAALDLQRSFGDGFTHVRPVDVTRPG